MLKLLKPYIELLRPRQWVKNLFVLAPLIFGFKLLDPHALFNASLAFVIFCLVASSIYILNDLRDIEADRQHLKNCKRPLARGAATVRNAIFLAVSCVAIAILLAVTTLANGILSWQFYSMVIVYSVINVGYCLGLKHIPLFEMFLVASGYVIRVIAGCVAISVVPSPWIIVATGVVSLLIVAGKRRAEIVGNSDSQKLRKSAAGYNIAFLDSLISIFGSASIITYMLFTLSEHTVQRYHTENLIYSSIFVVYGVTRYILLIKVSEGAEAPTDLVTSDLGIGLAVLFWVISLIVIIYL